MLGGGIINIPPPIFTGRDNAKFKYSNYIDNIH